MRSRARGLLLVACGLLAAALAGVPCEAGYIETIGFGPREAGMGGAATAVADSASAWYYNPAGLGQLDREDIQEVGLSQVVLPFVTQRSSAAEGGSSRDITPPIYNVYFPGTFRVGVPGLVFDLGGGTTWGTAIEWDQNRGPLRYSAYETSTFVETLSPAVGYRIGDSGFYVGATFNVSALRQMENRQKLGDGFFTDAAIADIGVDLPFLRDLLNSKNGVDDGKFEIQSDQEFPTGLAPSNTLDIDFAHFNYHLGLMYRKPGVPFSYGITYRDLMAVDYEGRAAVIWADDVKRLVNDNPLLVSLNGGPLADEATRFRYRIIFPRQVAIGVAYRPSEELIVAIDGVWTNWATAWNKQRIQFLGDGLLGVKEQVFQRQFNDTFSVRAGVEYRVTADVRVQAGFWFDPTPVPKTTVDSGTLDGNRFVYSAGVTWREFLNHTFDAPALAGLDLSTVAQLLHYPLRKFAVGQSVNLGGSKDFSTTVNDFPLELEALALSLGATLIYRY